MLRVVLIAFLFGLYLAGCSKVEETETALSQELPSPVILEEALPPVDETPQQPIPESTSTLFPTSTILYSADVLMNANCRSGPGTIYQVVAGYFTGDKVDLVGISPDGEWWVVRMAGDGATCWIWGQLLSAPQEARDLPVFPMPPTPMVPAAGPGDVNFELALLDLINAERANAGVGLLTMDSRLVAAARSHSTDMAINDFFDHTGTGSTTFGQRISAQGYIFSAAGETLFAGGDAATCIQMWLDSPTHRETMLSPLFTQVGIGVFWYTESTYPVYVTADYGSP